MLLDHIAIICSSDKSVEFYRQLGFEVKSQEDRGYDQLIYMSDGITTLEIYLDGSHPARVKNPEACLFNPSSTAILIEVTEQSLIDYKSTHPQVSDLPKGQIEALYIQSKISEHLSSSNTYVIHGSSIQIDEKYGFIFIGHSGIGKSTHTRLLNEYYSSRVKYINDDKPFIKENEDKLFSILPSPFKGKENIGNNISSSLNGIFIIKRSKRCSVKLINPSKAINLVKNFIHIPETADQSNVAAFLIDLSQRIPIYELKVNISETAAKTSMSQIDKIIKQI